MSKFVQKLNNSVHSNQTKSIMFNTVPLKPIQTIHVILNTTKFNLTLAFRSFLAINDSNVELHLSDCNCLRVFSTGHISYSSSVTTSTSFSIDINETCMRTEHNNWHMRKSDI